MDPYAIGRAIQPADDADDRDSDISDGCTIAMVILNSSDDPNIGQPVEHFFKHGYHAIRDRPFGEAVSFLHALFRRIDDNVRVPFDFYSAMIGVNRQQFPFARPLSAATGPQEQMSNLHAALVRLESNSTAELGTVLWEAAFRYHMFRTRATALLATFLRTRLLHDLILIIDSFFS
jgi:hypothetical protein